MIEQHEKNLKELLQLKPGSINILKNIEDSHLEFKKSFNMGSKDKYAKTMAAFANTSGGYIVFGIEDSPHIVHGINLKNFEGTDSAKITNFLNNNFSPEIIWNRGSISLSGKEVGYLYSHEIDDKPIVCTKTAGNELKEGTIYYRYNAVSTAIKYPALRDIIDYRLKREHRAWMQHLETIGRVGPTKVGVLDTVDGKLFGAGAPYLIDESLLKDIKFIREGKFKDSGGTPTLKLIGEVKPINSKGKDNGIKKVGIHPEDLYTVFLEQGSLSANEAISYFNETAYQNTHYVPLFYFINKGKLNINASILILEQTKSSRKYIKDKLVSRLNTQEIINPIGVLRKDTNNFNTFDKETLLTALSQSRTAPTERTILAIFLKNSPESILEKISYVNTKRICEAITHLNTEELRIHKIVVFKILEALFTEQYFKETSASSIRTSIRMAIAFCDEALYRDLV